MDRPQRSDPAQIFAVEGFDHVVALGWHDGELATAVRTLKYGRDPAVVTGLADALAAAAPVADVVTWVPATPARRRRRGFDQSELLARAVARRRGMRVAGMLRRVDSRAQTGRDRGGRVGGPEVVRRGWRRPCPDARLLVIDDVSTTGATLRAAADALSAWVEVAPVGLVVTRARPSPRRQGADEHLLWAFVPTGG